ncbi:hypothetical protein EAH78_08720 [Pseudomonas arsenicoxydans]|uniref:Uncharacterized protein n=1 Tax=Pseudomonas arsenicoxydans TaxID=702115 RepID=A0A502I1H1_9PSED|nr:hypothetical protein EAH78_08720 [Pseudomonas arsenicoxydans]
MFSILFTKSLAIRIYRLCGSLREQARSHIQPRSFRGMRLNVGAGLLAKAPDHPLEGRVETNKPAIGPVYF